MSYGYIKESTIILNFSNEYYNTPAKLVNSEVFYKFINKYVNELPNRDSVLNDYINGNVSELVLVIKQMISLKIEEINSPLITNLENLLNIIHDIFNYWKSFDRYIVVESGSNKAIQNDHFLDITTEFQALVRDLYRHLEETITGREILVYRQLDSGSNAAISVYTYKEQKYIKKIMLRTPLLLYPKTTIRSGNFKETFDKPTCFLDATNSYTLAVKIGLYTCHIKFHKDFISTVTALANLYEIVGTTEVDKKPDMVMYYGNLDNTNSETFYQDDNIIYGNLSYGEALDYFGYCKKMSLTLHNIVAMNNGILPIHGAFFNVVLNDGREKNIMMIGDSGAGKSETIEAVSNMGKDVIKKINVIFDDMGVIKPDLFAMGTEIGAFIRLDDLEAGTSYRDMDRSIFMNPDKLNARVIVPISNYNYITQNHKIDMLLYANNYTDEIGYKQFNNIEEIVDTFVNAKRMAMATTNEIGISTTYFANPFGPMQRQEQCNKLIGHVLGSMLKTDTFIGEGYTHLGINKDGKGINELAKQIIDFL